VLSLFRTGQASPIDRNSSGQTLLDVAFLSFSDALDEWQVAIGGHLDEHDIYEALEPYQFHGTDRSARSIERSFVQGRYFRTNFDSRDHFLSRAGDVLRLMKLLIEYGLDPSTLLRFEAGATFSTELELFSGMISSALYPPIRANFSRETHIFLKWPT
jgi:hypothetical protein